MKSFGAKDRQTSCLQSIAAYCAKRQELGDADYAFQKTTQELWGRRAISRRSKGISRRGSFGLPVRRTQLDSLPVRDKSMIYRRISR